MNVKKLLCMALALMLALGTLAIAESSDDLQAQLDAANARIAELEALVEKYQPVYESQIVAEYGDGNVIMLADAQAQYQAVKQMYAQYGLSVDAYSSEIKQDILESLVENAVLSAKITELGLDQFDEATLADLTAKAEEDWEGYITYVETYLTGTSGTDEENRAAAVERLTSMGYSLEALLEERKNNYTDEKLVEYVTADVTVTDDEVQETYRAKIASDKETFESDDDEYNSTRLSGDVIAWNPVGYRAVKHVLIKFDDSQSQQYSELHTQLDSLQAELDALDEAEAMASEEDATEEAEETEAEETEAVETEAEETEAEPAQPRTREEIQSDIGTVGAAIEALYAELMPKAQEVIDAFNAGTSFEDLIAQYGEDPGMNTAPADTIGYAVCEDSTYWEQAFTDGAMSIAEVGQISEPVRGRNGVHIIYYMSDITPGDVEYETIKDDLLSTTLEAKKEQVYADQVAAWVEEANPVYHMDRFN